MKPCLALLLAVAPLLAAAQAQHAHVHGVVKLDVAIDGERLTLQMEAPLDSLLGFERAPRTAAERDAAAALLARLKNGEGLFAPEPAAQCRFEKGSAESDALAPGAQPGGHADLDASFEYRCAAATKLRSLDLAGLMGAYRRIRRVEAQVAAPAGQFKPTLERPQTVLRWGPMTGPVAALAGVRFRWPGAAADTLAIESLDIAAGETVFLRGPSGCGKSTLLALLSGVLLAGAGRVELLGQDWRGLSSGARDRRRADHLGVVFQQFNLLPYLSVLDNARLPCRFSAARAARAGEGAAQALLERMGLDAAFWARPAAELSVGQQQRVAAARALVGQPELVIADEPTSALDEALRDGFMDLLLQACAEAGSALVFVSHDARLAGRFERRLDLTELNRA